MTSIYDIFDTWDVLFKARKAKGLAKWNNLSHMADTLEGKTKKDITFTCSHADHPGEVHVLGSTLGTLHFLLGYGNPAFYLAPYHFMIMDPTLTEKEATSLLQVKGHPSRLELWKRVDLDMEDEGDFAIGHPHPAVASLREKEQKRRLREQESVTVRAGSGSYTGVPSEGLVFGEHNGHVYPWSIVKDSFMTAAHPELVDAMEEANKEKVKDLSKLLDVSKSLKTLIPSLSDFDSDVYPLVKSVFPKPGSLVPLGDIYGIVKSSCIDFYDHQGNPTSVVVYDHAYDSFDLSKGGNIHPSILFNFATEYFSLDRDSYLVFVNEKDGNESSL